MPACTPCMLMDGEMFCVTSTKACGCADLIFFCSPNNPTGAAATRKQLEELVAFAKKNGSLIVYDAAYALYIDNPDCPKSIFEIEGAHEVCVNFALFCVSRRAHVCFRIFQVFRGIPFNSNSMVSRAIKHICAFHSS